MKSYLSICSCRRLPIGFVLVFLVVHTVNGGEPYRPSSDNEVVEILPSSPLLSRDQMVLLRERLRAEPKNLEVATAAARGYLKMGQSASDPRYYGYAMAAIEPWSDDAQPPASIVLLRSKLHEKDHNYGLAIEELESLLKRDPNDSQAWIEVANLYRVKGNYPKSWEACEALNQSGGELQFAVCRIPLMAVNGRATEADEMLAALRPLAEKKLPELVQWVVMMQGEVARILGHTRDAEAYFREALATESDSIYLKRTYAEFLLDQDRPKEALEIVRDQVGDDGSLLLAAIAARRSNQTAWADNWQTQLKNLYEEIRLRGSQPHGRFEARYSLELTGETEKALDIALETWTSQKESRDARNVLQSALAADNPQAASAVIQFLKANRTEDIELQKLVQQLEQK